MWVNGGFPGRMSDITISRDEGLFDQLGGHSRVMADLGYRGTDDELLTAYLNPRTAVRIELGAELNALRSRIENINSRIKIFRCFGQPWRHTHQLLTLCFYVACKITNISLDTEPLKRIQ